MSNDSAPAKGALPEPELVILPRPQISVTQISGDELEITVSGISDDFNNVEINDVRIPIDCARQVANALLSIAQDAGL